MARFVELNETGWDPEDYLFGQRQRLSDCGIGVSSTKADVWGAAVRILAESERELDPEEWIEGGVDGLYDALIKRQSEKKASELTDKAA